MRALPAVLLLLLIIGGVLLLIHVNEKSRCQQIAKTMDRQYDYVLFYGCVIEYRPGEWVPLWTLREGGR